MSEATVRAAIKQVIESVSGYGVCHDYMRWSNDYATLLSMFKVKINGTDQIRGWSIFCEAVNSQWMSFGTIRKCLVTYHYRLRFIMALDDSVASEKTALAHVLAVADALDKSVTLHSSTYTVSEETTGLCQVEFGWRLFGSVLCHEAQVVLDVQEIKDNG